MVEIFGIAEENWRVLLPKAICRQTFAGETGK
jgi:hypothetical protein